MLVMVANQEEKVRAQMEAARQAQIDQLRSPFLFATSSVAVLISKDSDAAVDRRQPLGHLAAPRLHFSHNDFT